MFGTIEILAMFYLERLRIDSQSDKSFAGLSTYSGTVPDGTRNTVQYAVRRVWSVPVRNVQVLYS